MANIKLNIKKRFFNEAYLPYLETTDRVNVFYGGAGSGKSHFVVQKMLIKALKSPRKMLVIRKVTATLRDSIFAEFQSAISKFGLYDQCKIVSSLLTIELPNGSQLIFKGMDDPEKIKSIAGIDDIIIEEATELTVDDYSQLQLRLRSNKPNNQVILMYNPVSKANWVYKMFHENGCPENCRVIHTTWKDNKFLPQSYIDNLMQMAKTNPVYYKIYAEGEFATLDKLIFPGEMWEVGKLDISKLRKSDDWVAVFGSDFGYTNDPATLVCCFVNKKEKLIYVFDEHYEKGMTNEDIYKMVVDKGYAKEIITFDGAEPKSIDHLKKLGLYRARSARKGKDSILNGIDFIHQFKVIIDPKCVNFKMEIENYTWKKDKVTNEYVNVPIDNFNHCLTGDTLVHTLDGDKPIKELVGEEGFVYCYDEYNNTKTQSTFHTVRMTQKNADVYRIKLKNGGIIKATENHPVYTESGWKPINLLTEEDKILYICC